MNYYLLFILKGQILSFYVDVYPIAALILDLKIKLNEKVEDLLYSIANNCELFQINQKDTFVLEKSFSSKHKIIYISEIA